MGLTGVVGESSTKPQQPDSAYSFTFLLETRWNGGGGKVETNSQKALYARIVVFSEIFIVYLKRVYRVTREQSFGCK